MRDYENEQYEKVWKSDFKYFCRTRNTDTNQVRIEEISPKYEYFEKNKNGEFSYILDPSVKLSKREFTSSKEEKEFKGLMDSLGKELYGGQRPEYKHIRDNFFNNGKNNDMRIWFFDIETVEENKYGRDYEIRVRVKS